MSAATETLVELELPEMGESVTEGTVTRWLVAVGDQVAREQSIVEISTDKVDAEIPSPAAGTVREILVEEGATIVVHTVLATIALAPGAAAPEPRREAATTAPKRRPTDEAPETRGPASAARGADRSANATATGGGRRVFATPVARRMARRLQIDLRTVAGSGSRGRIMKADVESVAARLANGGRSRQRSRSSPPPTARPPAVPRQRASAIAPGVEPSAMAADEVEIQPMSRIRELTAEHMIRSQATSAHVTTVFHADFSRIVGLRARNKQQFADTHGTKLTFMPFICKAVIAALQKYPRFNASIEEKNIVLKKSIHLGLAVATERGLLVPVIHHADRLDLAGLAQSANDLAERARSKKLKPDEITRGTFTITNPGVFGSLFGTPIINQPQVAILCVGTIEKRPVVEATADGRDTIVVRSMAYLALTYDHRLIDGADAEIFMTHVLTTLQTSDWPELGGQP